MPRMNFYILTDPYNPNYYKHLIPKNNLYNMLWLFFQLFPVWGHNSRSAGPYVRSGTCFTPGAVPDAKPEPFINLITYLLTFRTLNLLP